MAFPFNVLVRALIASGATSKTFGVTLSSVVGGTPTSRSAVVTIDQVPAPNVIVPVITTYLESGYVEAGYHE